MKIVRRKLNEVLLAERLGLNDIWLDRDGDEQKCLPDSLPAFLLKSCTREEIEQLEAGLDQLVTAGCRFQPLYFCLEQLSPEAEEIRSGREWVSTKSKDDEEDDTVRIRKPSRSRREDLELVRNNALAARSLIHRYQSELLRVAELNANDLPIGMMSRPENPNDALSLLESSLTWVSKLASAYTASYEATLLKSKGLLYLTAYVRLFANSRELRASRRTTRSQSRRGKVSALNLYENALASVASLATGKDGGWSCSDLDTKLNKFNLDYPRLSSRLTTNLRELHAAASR